MDDKLQRVMDVMYQYRRDGVGLEDKAKSIVQMFNSDTFAQDAMATNFGRRLAWAAPENFQALEGTMFLAEFPDRSLSVLRVDTRGRLLDRAGFPYEKLYINRMAVLPDLGMEW